MKNYLQCKEELESALKDFEEDISALEAVKTRTRKDGKPFADLNSNFENAKITVDFCGRAFLTASVEGKNYPVILGFAGADEKLALTEAKDLIDGKKYTLRKSIAITKAKLEGLPKAYDAVLRQLKKIAEENKNYLFTFDCDDLFDAQYHKFSNEK